MATNPLPPEYIGDPMAPRPADLSARRAMERSPAAIVVMVLLLGFIVAGAIMLIRGSDEMPTSRGVGHGATHRG